MARLPAVKPKEAIIALERAGFTFIRQKGSHRIYAKGRLSVTIPFHAKDLKRGTLSHIIKQAGLTLEEFLNLL